MLAPSSHQTGTHIHARRLDLTQLRLVYGLSIVFRGFGTHFMTRKTMDETRATRPDKPEERKVETPSLIPADATTIPDHDCPPARAVVLSEATNTSNNKPCLPRADRPDQTQRRK
jgi:hypothetical protein